MAIMTLQGEAEKRKNICYQFDTAIEPIGEGGMGKVFKGVCIDMNNGSQRPVAIKFMFDDLPASAYERARREASIQLRNDNLVEMLGFIETEERNSLGDVTKHFHVVSELLTGVSLADILDGKTQDRDGEDVPFAVKMLQDYRNNSERFATRVVINILSGLMALHDAGYIHRDIDPSNIMLTADGHIKLIDFGIAKQMNNLTTNDKSLTVAGKFMGKPEYAAPELALGDIKHQNQTTDIYAVGILLYQCILGHTPFEGARHEILENQIKGKMPLGKIKSKPLRDIISTACQKKQELRYQSSAQMRVALENMGGSRQALNQKRKFSIIAAAVAIIIVLGGATFAVMSKQNKVKEEAEQARIEQVRTETRTMISSKVSEAEGYAKLGFNKEEDEYEKKLMSAYTAYSEVEKLIEANPDLGFTTEQTNDQLNQIAIALDSAKYELANKSVLLKDFGVNDLSEAYQQRSNAVEEFIKTNIKQ